MLVESLIGAFSCCVAIYPWVEHAGCKWCQAYFITSFDSSHELNGLWAAPPYMGSLSVNQVSERESAWEVAEVRNVSSFSAKSVFWERRTAVLNISKQQIVWDQSAALGFITQFSSVIVPKQKVWLAWKEHLCGMGTLLWNQCGWMGNSGEDSVQNLSCCTFCMMKFPLLKQTKPKEKKVTERTEGFCGRTVLHMLFCIMK